MSLWPTLPCQCFCLQHWRMPNRFIFHWKLFLKTAQTAPSGPAFSGKLGPMQDAALPQLEGSGKVSRHC